MKANLLVVSAALAVVLAVGGSAAASAQRVPTRLGAERPTWQAPPLSPLASATSLPALHMTSAPLAAAADYRWEGLYIGAISLGLPFGVAGADLGCHADEGFSPTVGSCVGLTLFCAAVGATIGGVAGGLIGGLFPKSEPAEASPP